MLPPRPLLVLALALAPASFFLNPAGWVLALMLAPDGSGGAGPREGGAGDPGGPGGDARGSPLAPGPTRR